MINKTKQKDSGCLFSNSGMTRELLSFCCFKCLCRHSKKREQMHTITHFSHVTLTHLSSTLQTQPLSSLAMGPVSYQHGRRTAITSTEIHRKARRTAKCARSNTRWSLEQARAYEKARGKSSSCPLGQSSQSHRENKSQRQGWRHPMKRAL